QIELANLLADIVIDLPTFVANFYVQIIVTVIALLRYDLLQLPILMIRRHPEQRRQSVDDFTSDTMLSDQLRIDGDCVRLCIPSQDATAAIVNRTARRRQHIIRSP